MAWGPGGRLLTASAVLCLARCWLGPLFSSSVAGDAFIGQGQTRRIFAGRRLDEVFRTDAKRHVALQARNTADLDSLPKSVLLDALASMGYKCSGAFKKRDLVGLLEGLSVPSSKIRKELNKANQKAESRKQKQVDGEHANKQTNGKQQTNGHSEKKEREKQTNKKKNTRRYAKGMGNGVSTHAMRAFLSEIGHPDAFSVSRGEALDFFEDMGIDAHSLESMLGDGHIDGDLEQERPPRRKNNKNKRKGRRRRRPEDDDFWDYEDEGWRYDWEVHHEYEYADLDDEYYDIGIDDFLDPDFAKFHIGVDYQAYAGRQQRRAGTGRSKSAQQSTYQPGSSTRRQATSATAANPEQAMAKALREKWQSEKLSQSQAQQLLGVTDVRDASQVRAARKQLVLKWHPDRNPDNPDASKALSLVMAACAKLTA